MLYYQYQKSGESLVSERIEYQQEVREKKEEIQEFLSSSKSLDWPEYEIIDTESVDGIVGDMFSDIFDIVDLIEEEEVVFPIPVIMQYEYPVLSESFVFVSEWEVKLSNMSDYEYKNYENYIWDGDIKNFIAQTEYIWVVDVSDTDYIVYYKNIDYTYENFVHDLKIFSFYLWGLFLLIFIVIFWWVGIILKPLSKNYASMDEFIHNAGHELKTPLASIMSSIGIMKKTKSYDEEIVSEVISETQKSKKMIEALRDISRIESSGKVEWFYVWEKIKEIESTVQNHIQEKNLAYSFDLREDFQIEADANHFYICISNILKNAIKYNKDTWTIRVLVEKKKISIIDTGIGMSKTETKKVFDRFYRSNNHRDGTWLWVWLFLVAKIAKIYKWKMKLASIPHEGTTFIIQFP